MSVAPSRHWVSPHLLCVCMTLRGRQVYVLQQFILQQQNKQKSAPDMIPSEFHHHYQFIRRGRQGAATIDSISFVIARMHKYLSTFDAFIGSSPVTLVLLRSSALHLINRCLRVSEGCSPVVGQWPTCLSMNRLHLRNSCHKNGLRT